MEEKSTREQLYPHYRLSAKSTSAQAPYALIEKLRSVREDGFRDIEAAEHYDPDFSLHLAACTTPEDAEHLLTQWLEHRTNVLRATQAELRRVWQDETKRGTVRPD